MSSINQIPTRLKSGFATRWTAVTTASACGMEKLRLWMLVSQRQGEGLGASGRASICFCSKAS